MSHKRGKPLFTAHGKSFASFGEIAQGRLSSGEDFLISLPIDMWNHCQLTVTAKVGATTIETPLSKAKNISELLVDQLTLPQGLLIKLSYHRNIPIGKGLSSSTADLLATIRAFEAGFGRSFSQTEISRLLHLVEPHDPLHHPQCVAYNHRQGELLAAFGYIPNYHIIGIDRGGMLSTEAYNDTLSFSESDLIEYDVLYQALTEAFKRCDDVKIAQCATRSTTLHASRSNDKWLADFLLHTKKWDVMGVITTHSGTCTGILVSPTTKQNTLNKITEQAQKFGELFLVNTRSI